jgi:hypothetical protein
MNWKGRGRKRSWPNLKYFCGIRLEILRKPMKNSQQPVSGSRFEAGISRIRSKSADNYTATLGRRQKRKTKEQIQTENKKTAQIISALFRLPFAQEVLSFRSEGPTVLIERFRGFCRPAPGEIEIRPPSDPSFQNILS